MLVSRSLRFRTFGLDIPRFSQDIDAALETGEKGWTVRLDLGQRHPSFAFPAVVRVLESSHIEFLRQRP